MDWAEELKMSFRKTTARKGRRAKPAAKDTASTALSSTTTSSKPNDGNDVQDIILGLQQTSITADTSIVTTPSSASDTLIDSSIRRPPRKILGGWADNNVSKILKSKKNSLENDRFQHASAEASTSSMSEVNIPIIPDLDDVKDEILMNEIVEPPKFFVDSVTLKELNLDMFSHRNFSAVEDVDLTILSRCLNAPETLEEPDELWEWDKLFNDVVAEIHSEAITAGNTSAINTPENLIKSNI